MVSFFLPWKFPTLNDYIEKERIHRQVAAKMKKEWTENVQQFVQNEMRKKKWTKFSSPVAISFEWYEENSRRDPDNIIFAKKFILDGIVTAGLLPNDNQKWILAFDESWSVDPKKVGVMVSMAEYD